MNDVAVMEERARWALFHGLKNAYTYSSLEGKKRKAKWKIGLTIPLTIALMAAGISLVVKGADLYAVLEVLGFSLYTISFMVGLIVSLVAFGDLESLSKPNESDLRKLDLAMKSSSLISSLILDDKFSNQIQMTKALINELYNVAESEASGEYLKAWSEIRSQYTQHQA